MDGTTGKSTGVEMVVVGSLALIAVVALVFLGICVKYGAKSDLAPIISIASMAVGALASLLVKLTGQGTTLPVTLETTVPNVSRVLAAPDAGSSAQTIAPVATAV